MRTKVAASLGGLKNLQQSQYISFSITRYKVQAGDTLSEKRFYRMHPKKTFFQETKLEMGDTIISTYEDGKGFRTAAGETTDLDAISTNNLYQQLYYNFIYLVGAENKWSPVGEMTYKGKPVKIFSITDKNKIAQEIHLLIDPDTFQIISSSIPEDGQYTYFADEYDYQWIPCLGINFPLRYEVVQNDSVLQSGTFSDFCLASETK